MRAAPQTAGFARQNDEDRLSDFLGVMRIAGEAQRGGINEVHIPRNEAGKRRLGFGAGELREQFMVVRFGHLPVRCPRTAKLDKLFHLSHPRERIENSGFSFTAHSGNASRCSCRRCPSLN